MPNMPDWNAEIRARLVNVRLSPEREAEIVDELSQHLEDRWRESIAAGASPEDAATMTLAAFSRENVLGQYLTRLRQARWIDPAPPAAARAFSLEGLGADLRHAVRGLRASPSFAIGALLVLTLGIGATTAIFSVVDAVVLRGLPFSDADRIVAVGERPPSPTSTKGPSAGTPKRPTYGPTPGLQPSMGPPDPTAIGRSRRTNLPDWVATQQ